MSLCTSCGNEVNSENKFCGTCGEPLKTESSSKSGPENIILTGPPPPPPPSSSLPTQSSMYPEVPTPIKPEKPRSDKIVLAGLCVVAIIATLIYAGFPWIKMENKGIPDPTNTISHTPMPTTLISRSTSISPTTIQTPAQTTVYIRNEAFDQINMINKQFDLGKKETFSYNLKQLPMVIQLELDPKMVSDQKLVNIGTSNEHYVTATYADPNAWFELNVINADTGTVETTLIYRKNINGMLKQDYTIRSMGNYRFEMSGNEMHATVQFLTKKP